MLEVLNLEKHYPGFSLALDFTVAPGETLVLAGPSGCGKTTALNLLAGLLAPDGGRILLNGRDITALPAWKRDIAVVFQDLALFPHLNVWRNVAYGLFIRGVPRRERRERAEALLDRVRLPGYGGRSIATLSGGERQRVAIARALAVSPAALLLDEPFSSLDAPLRRELRAEFRDLLTQAAFPCVFVTHDREEAAFLADRVLLLEGGRVREEGPPRALFLAPATGAGCRFFGGGQALPAVVRGEEAGRLLCDTPLGRLRAPAPQTAPPASGEALLFIPWDALHLPASPETAPAGSLRVRARLLAVLFEGTQLRLRLELPGPPPHALEAAARPRAWLPPPGEEFPLGLDEDALRLLLN